ncbi:hypothetical protein EMCRGX_G023585 [Ephydatia muelleri]
MLNSDFTNHVSLAQPMLAGTQLQVSKLLAEDVPGTGTMADWRAYRIPALSQIRHQVKNLYSKDSITINGTSCLCVDKGLCLPS